MKGISWLSDVEWARIEPLLPRGRKGAHRVDDRRVISGIVHMLRSGARWRDCPPFYGPYTTIYNRFNRWSRQGLWFAIFEALTGHSGIYGLAAIDSTHIKAHRSAAGGKGGFRASARHLARRPNQQAPRRDRRDRPTAADPADRRQRLRRGHRTGASGCPRAIPAAGCRPRI
jgi:transposase